jgi:hypothetical protein
LAKSGLEEEVAPVGLVSRYVRLDRAVCRAMVSSTTWSPVSGRVSVALGSRQSRRAVAATPVGRRSRVGPPVVGAGLAVVLDEHAVSSRTNVTLRVRSTALLPPDA